MILKKVDRDLAVIHGKLKIGILQPINANEEKLKVFKDNCYNPKFNYSTNRKDYDKIEKLLLSLKPVDGIYGKLLKEKIKELYYFSKMLRSRGKKEFTAYSIKKYGKPSQELVKEANRILKRDEEEVWRKYSRISMTKKFMDEFNLNHLNWKVEEKEMVSGAAFNTKNKKMYNDILLSLKAEVSQR